MTVKRVHVGDVLSLLRRPVAIEPSADYVFLGVSASGGGFFKKPPTPGSAIRPGSAFAIEFGDFVYSRLFAWRGSFEIAGVAEAGSVVSGEFPTFAADRSRVDAHWLRYWFLSETGLREVGDRSAGSTPGSRNRLREDRFLGIQIPLPPIEQQRSIAHRLDRLQAATSVLRHHSDRASTLISALAVSASARPDLSDAAKASAGWRRVNLGSVMTPASGGVPVELDAMYPNLGIYSFGRGLFAKADIDGSATSAKVLNRVRAGQFIYSRLFAFEGAYTYVSPEFDGYHVSNEFPAFDTDPEHLDARWLANYLRSPERWAELGGASKGLGVRRQRVPVEAVMAYRVWLPPISVQQAIVATIDRLDRGRARRVDAKHRINSLVPAAVNRAFASSI